MSEYPICVRCNQPVKVAKDQYEVFERMHWLCFHLEFEHGDYDPDEPCEDPSCPWNRLPGMTFYKHVKHRGLWD
jgi:hypothetical protein